MERKTHWVKWAQLCERKVSGGLGMTKFDLFNQPMLAKQGWNIISNPYSLIARFYKALYFPSTFFLQAKSPTKSSLYWRGLIWGRCLLTKGIGWRVSNGTQINIREDNWLLVDTYFKLYHPHSVPHHLIKVAHLIDWHTISWNSSPLHQYFSTIDVDRIIKIPLSTYPVDNKLAWLPARDGQFTVRRA